MTSTNCGKRRSLIVERAYAPLIYGLRDADRYLYHYTKAETALTHILPMNRLRLGRFENTNDPRETRHWHFSSHSPRSAVDLAKYDLDELSELVGGTFEIPDRGTRLDDGVLGNLIPLQVRERNDQRDDLPPFPRLVVH